MSAPRTGPFLARVRRFLSESVWEQDTASLSGMRRLAVRAIKVVHMVWRGFRDNQCPLHASALTYTTLVSIVPIMALALAVLRGLGAGELAEQRIMQSITAMPAEFQQFVGDILNYVNRTSFTALGGIGLVFLLVIVVQMLGQVEMALNRVWGVQVSRHLLRRFADYLSVMVVVPILVLAAATLNATMASTAFINFLQQRFKTAAELYVQLMKLAPMAGTWLAFCVLYKFMPNTRVRLGPAVASGVVGGSLWIGWQWLYITFQVGVANYNKIYATFASVFIFLLWVYVGWQIVLLGAEIGFALQNHATYGLEQRAHSASMRSRVFLALSILADAADALTGMGPPLSLAEFSERRLVPVRLINEVVGALVGAGYLAELAEKPGVYALLKTPDRITVNDVVSVFFGAGAGPDSLGLDRMDPVIGNVLGAVDTVAAEALSRHTMADIARMRRQPAESGA